MVAQGMLLLLCATGIFATLSEIVVIEPVEWKEPPLAVASTASTIEVDVSCTLRVPQTRA